MEPVVPSVFDEMEQYKPVNYATTWQRFFNFVIDWIVRFGLAYVVGMLMGFFSRATGIDIISFLSTPGYGNMFYRLVFSYAISFVFYALIEGLTKGYSLGKLVTGTKAVKNDGSDISMRDAVIRSAGRLIPFEPFSVFSGLGMWHDTMADTRVIKIR